MGFSLYATQHARPAHPRRGLGIILILVGLFLAVPWVVVEFFCSPVFPGVCLPSSYVGAAGFVAGVGLSLMILGPLLVFTRWQFARNAGFCPSCGANIGRADKFCARCGARLW